MMKKILIVIALVALGLSQAFCQSTKWPRIESHVKKDPQIEQKIQKILAKLSLEQKVGQMMQAEIKHASPEDVKKYNLGSVLNGGGSFPNNNKYAKVSDWVSMADSYYNASVNSSSKIPLIWGTDAVHGHNNVFGATIFPHNIGLGAARNPRLMKSIGEATALEVLATGLDWIFAPTVAVVRNDHWGRAYEGYSEEPSIVKDYAGLIVYGMQGEGQNIFGPNNVVSTAKHFIGDGGTLDGVDQGNNISTEQELMNLHAQGYFSALAAGAQTVMASFNSWNGNKVHGSHYLLTEVLKNQMGFDGFVVGDWNGHGQVKGCTNESCAQAINAGVDMIMVPKDWKALLKNTIAQVRSGKISMERIDDAVTRILRVKFRAGLDLKGPPSTRPHAANKNIVGSQKHRDLARAAVRQSLVLLKNKNNILPLNANKRILVTGSGAHNIGQQSGGWTLTWQGTGNQNSDFPGATSIYDGIEKIQRELGGSTELSFNGEYNQKPDLAVVVFGETPYAEGQGDITDLVYNWKYPENLELLRKFKAQNIPVVSIFLTGRPLWINPELNLSDAFVVAWLPGSEGIGVAEVLFNQHNYDFTGKLSFSWPKDATQATLNIGADDYHPLFAFGYGLSYSDTDTLGDELSENPFPGGSLPAPTGSITIFKGRSYQPFKSYVGDFANWMSALRGDSGVSRGGLVDVIAIDKDIQEDARQVHFKGGDSNYYFQSMRPMDISGFVKTNGVLKLDIRVDKRPDNEANILLGTAKMNFNHYLNTTALNIWETISIDLSCFQGKGADLSALVMPMSLATFGSMKVSIANVEILENPLKSAKKLTCR
jgi:beta-glucosidase